MDKTMVKEQLEGVKKSFEERHASLLDDTMLKEEKVERLTLRLQEKEKFLEELQGELSKERGSRQTATRALQSELDTAHIREAAATRTLTQTHDRMRTLQVEVVALRERTRPEGSPDSATVALNDRVHQLMRENHTLTSDMRAQRLGREQAEEARKKADALVSEVLAENTALNHTLSQEHEAVRSGDAHSLTQSSHHAKLVDYQNEIEKLNRAMSVREQEGHAKQNELSKLRDELAGALEELSFAKNRHTEKERLLVRLHAEEGSLETTTRKMRAALQLKTQLVEEGERVSGRLRSQVKDMAAAKERLEGRLAHMESDNQKKHAEHEEMSKSITQLISKMAPGSYAS